jgi:hypothetical protein
MQVKITTRWPAVKPGDVYPTTFKPGDTVDGELAKLALELNVGEPDVETKAASTVVRGKVKKNVEGFAEGLIVEGEEARELIAAGKAVLVKDKGGAPETK